MAGPRDLPRTFGDYRLERVLGTGAITTAYLASRTSSGERVVLKQIHPYLLEQQEEVDLFLSEAQVLAALDHPKIGRILDVGLVEGVPYLSLEFLSGRDLTEVLLKRESGETRPLPLSLSLFVGRSVAAALAHAHEARDERGRSLRIVHRDVSPNNVILCFDGSVKLVDFGIARSALRATRTTVGMIRGTPGYMSPEQLRADVIDGRSDVFVLGTLLYRMIAGRPAFPVVSGELDTYRRPLTEEVAPLHLVRSEVPEALSVLVAQAMQKDVIDRIESAAVFTQALAKFAEPGGARVDEAQVADLMAWLFPEAAALSEQQARQQAERLAPGTPETLTDTHERALSYVRDDPGVVLPDFGESDALESTELFDEEEEEELEKGSAIDDTFSGLPAPLLFGASHPPTLDAPPPQMTPPAVRAVPPPAADSAWRMASSRGSGVSTARRAQGPSKRASIFGAIAIVAALVVLTVLAGMLFAF